MLSLRFASADAGSDFSWPLDHPAEAVARLPAAPAHRPVRVRNRTGNPAPPAFRPAHGRRPDRVDRRKTVVAHHGRERRVRGSA
ncbi:hypothetical protein [Tautonia rosea]|uniref:hypothetical protein n=1 Tax=Tautonia rosea TaxID=2728037 RepID=UPI0019D2AEBF|nr:hypothetical protein [Tautonia rosea]